MHVRERCVIGRTALAALAGATFAIAPAACGPAGGAWTAAPASAPLGHASAGPSAESSMVTVAAPSSSSATLGVRDTAYRPPRVAPSLRLTDQDGRPFDLGSLRGEPVLVYFGYTHCPDICPSTLADLRDAVRLVAGPVAVLFVTVDPELDTPAAMKQYVDSFGAGFVGLSGSPAEVAAAAAAWGVSYRNLPAPSGSAGYPVAHSTDVYLVDPRGMLTDHIFFGAGARLIADLIQASRG